MEVIKYLSIHLRNSLTAHPWCSGHSTSINTCGVRRVRAEVQVSRREFHTLINLNYVRIEIISCIKKKSK